MAASVKLKASKNIFFSLSRFLSLSRAVLVMIAISSVFVLTSSVVRRTIVQKKALRPQNDKKQTSLSSLRCLCLYKDHLHCNIYVMKRRMSKEKKNEIRSFFSSTHKISKLPDKSCPNCNFSSTNDYSRMTSRTATTATAATSASHNSYSHVVTMEIC